MIKNRSILIIYKIIFGFLALSALITEVIALVHDGRFYPGNFFSYFTVEANSFATIMFLISAWVLARNRKTGSLEKWRGASTLYMVTTGIVFAVLLSGYDSGVLTAVPWDNTVLHYIIPIAALLDWIIDPPTMRIPFKKALYWLLCPIAYVIYSLVRGRATGWYPYPFLSPAKHGYLGVAITSLGVAAIVLMITWILLRLPVRRTLKHR